MKRDPIFQEPSGKASPKNASAGRIKSVSGGGPAFSSNPGGKTSIPVPNSPYKK